MTPQVVPGACVSKLPKLQFDILGQKYTLSGSEYTQPVDATKADTEYYVRVSGHGDNQANYWTLGQSFHARYNVTYNFFNTKVGLPILEEQNWFMKNIWSFAVPLVAVLYLTGLFVLVWKAKPGRARGNTTGDAGGANGGNGAGNAGANGQQPNWAGANVGGRPMNNAA